MHVVNDFRFRLGRAELIPIICGGMGVHFSGPRLAVEMCRLGGVGHISDAMSMYVVDGKFGTSCSQAKSRRYLDVHPEFEMGTVKFDPGDLYRTQLAHVESTMRQKRGAGAIFVNIMEKLTMAEPCETLRVRLNAALDGGIDGVTLSAGLHNHSLRLMESNPRFRDVKIGIIVSSCRALKIFLRSAKSAGRLPDYVIVEGPLAGGHLGFGADWGEHDLAGIVKEILSLLNAEDLAIPVIPAGGIFTGGDAVGFLEAGAAAVQVATRFVATEECGVPDGIKQKYLAAQRDEIVVNSLSPTGYLMRMLSSSPCITRRVRPNCKLFGYLLNKEGKCQYLDEYVRLAALSPGVEPAVENKTCLCYHFGMNSCYTCGQNVFRLKDTTHRNEDGSYQLLKAEHVFRDYQFSTGNDVALPRRNVSSDGIGFSHPLIHRP